MFLCAVSSTIKLERHHPFDISSGKGRQEMKIRLGRDGPGKKDGAGADQSEADSGSNRFDFGEIYSDEDYKLLPLHAKNLLAIEVVNIPDEDLPLPSGKRRVVQEIFLENGESLLEEVDGQYVQHFRDLYPILTAEQPFRGRLKWWWRLLYSHPGIEARGSGRFLIAMKHAMRVAYLAIKVFLKSDGDDDEAGQ
jgi:hypothetical protein